MREGPEPVTAGIPRPAYRQQSMPRVFWLFVAVFGGFTAVFVGGTVVVALDGGLGDGNPIAPALFLAVVLGVGATYGRRAAFGLDIDGSDLVWRAPLRRVAIPLADVARLQERSGTPHGTPSLLGERTGEVLTTSGDTWRVSIRDLDEARQFAEFARLLACQCPEIEIDVGGFEDDRAARRQDRIGRGWMWFAWLVFLAIAAPLVIILIVDLITGVSSP